MRNRGLICIGEREKIQHNTPDLTWVRGSRDLRRNGCSNRALEARLKLTVLRGYLQITMLPTNSAGTAWRHRFRRLSTDVDNKTHPGRCSTRYRRVSTLSTVRHKNNTAITFAGGSQSQKLDRKKNFNELREPQVKSVIAPPIWDTWPLQTRCY
jgi:hypothetical protein